METKSPIKISAINIKILLLGIILILASVRWYLADYLPILGDGCFHAAVAREIIETEHPRYTIHHILTDYEGGYPIFYTQFFYTSLAIVKIFTGSFKLLTPILGISTVLLFFLIGRDIFKSEIFGLVSGFVVCCYPQFILYTSTVFMESLVVFIFFITMYTHYKSVKQKSLQYLILCGLFLGVGVATKASLYFLPIAILFQHIFLKGKIKHYFYMIVICLFVSLPFFLFLYAGTGTILFPTGNEPIDNILPPRFIFSEDSSVIMNSLLVNRGVYNIDYLDPHTLFTFFNPSTYRYGWYHMEELVFFVFLLFGLFYLLKKENRKLMVWLAIPILTYYPILQITKIARYFLPIKLIGVFFVVSSFFFILQFKKTQSKRPLLFLSVVFTTVLVIAFIGAYAFGVQDTKNKEYTLIWQPSENKMSDAIEAFEYIQDHSSESSTIASSDKYSALYYCTNRNIIWIDWYGNAEFYEPLLNADRKGIDIQFYKNNVSHIIIFKNQLFPREKMSHPNQFPIETYNLIKHDMHFSLVFKKGEVEVYKFD